ncbi:3-methylaspartate ammonia-lyase [Gammaproteobacteria bacterium]|nr:3-methylaspartate ammonia-lyase [Gammaproteobacteria bacterium]
MKIVDVVCAAGRTGFFFDDQKAIKEGAKTNGGTYAGDPLTAGFTQVRQSGEAISIMYVLEDGQIAHGDCAAVQYSGASGRDPLFLAEQFIPMIEQEIAPLLIGQELNSFKDLCKITEGNFKDKQLKDKQLHTAIRYGLSQANLDAVAKSKHKLMAEVIASEYGQLVSAKAIPIFCQSGDNRYDGADKMIIKQADILPHALINNVADKLGYKGELLLEYITWLSKRIIELRPNNNYHPTLHLDLYGTVGIIFNNNVEKIVDYLATLEKAAYPFNLNIEGPVDTGERESQIVCLAAITQSLDNKGIAVKIVADEWCNTLEDVRDFADFKAGHILQIKTPDLGGINNTAEAVLYCKSKGVGAYQGGTCNETDRSAIVCTHVAMGCSPDQILAKPGMGVDEGYMIVFNEMNRILRLGKRLS